MALWTAQAASSARPADLAAVYMHGVTAPWVVGIVGLHAMHGMAEGWLVAQSFMLWKDLWRPVGSVSSILRACQLTSLHRELQDGHEALRP